MTPTTLAAAILRDVPRYIANNAGEIEPYEAGYLLMEDEVLAALTAAMDPALSERAGEVLEGVKAAEAFCRSEECFLQADHFRKAADLITALLARIAAMEAQIKGLEGGIEAACDREAETERKLRTALAASETRAEAAETALVAERAKTAKLVEALKVARAHVANNADGWSVSRAAARVDLTIVDAAITEATQ